MSQRQRCGQHSSVLHSSTNRLFLYATPHDPLIGVVCALAGLMTLCGSALPIASNTWKSLYARRRKRSWFISSAIRNNMGFECRFHS